MDNTQETTETETLKIGDERNIKWLVAKINDYEQQKFQHNNWINSYKVSKKCLYNAEPKVEEVCRDLRSDEDIICRLRVMQQHYITPNAICKKKKKTVID